MPLIDTLAELSGLPPRDVRRYLGEFEQVKRPEKHVGKLVMPSGVGPLLPQHRCYLNERGFNPDELTKLWHIGGIGLAPRLAWRLFIPIHQNGKVVSWTTRALTNDVNRRYVSAKKNEELVPHNTLLFGQDHCRHATIIVEGPIDAMKIGPGAIATLGVGYSKAQAAKIAKYPVRAIVFDNEPAAQARAKKLCALLEPLAGTTFRVEIDAPDPGSMSKKEVKLLRKAVLE